MSYNYAKNLEGIFTFAFPPEALHALANGLFLHMLQESFYVILKPKKLKGLLAIQLYEWNSYPAQHCMRSHSNDGYSRLTFASGITTITNTTADNKDGILFEFTIVCLQ